MGNQKGLQKGCTRLAAASDKVYQLLAHGRWFFPGTTASSTTNTDQQRNTMLIMVYNKFRLETTEWAIKKDNPEKLKILYII
jgi:hypothetical protein